ncbi:dynein-related subfamily protein [Salmonella phage 40]|nr:dynein-related subfamily protein [Salmonella phage 40]
MKNKEPKVKTPRDLFLDEESKRFAEWCRREEWDFDAFERRAAWVAWMGRSEKDLKAYLNSIVDYQIRRRRGEKIFLYFWQ